MTPSISLTDEFDSCAGANFGAIGLTLLSSGASVDAPSASLPLLLWLLSSEALARNDVPHQTWPWIYSQTELASTPDPSIGRAVRDACGVSCAAFMPILMMAPSAQQDDLCASFALTFPCLAELRAIRLVLKHLCTRYGRGLFQPGDWGAEIKNADKYATPDRASIIKLGLTLKQLAESSDDEDRHLAEEWQRTLKESVLHRMPSRITRGFAPAWPAFEDLVLAILAVAEWLSLPNAWRVVEIVRDLNHRPEERLTPDQLVLAGALYGWVRGYSSVGNWIESPAKRAAAARQGICHAVQRSNKAGDPRAIEQVVFYCTPAGLLSTFLQPYLQLADYTHEETYHARPGGKPITTVQDDAVLTVADGAFSFKLELA